MGEGNDVESLELPGVQRELVEAIVATANEIPPLWQISPALSTNYRRVVEELLPGLRALVASVIAEAGSSLVPPCD